MLVHLLSAVAAASSVRFRPFASLGEISYL